jgi:hypothetical protein
MSPVRYRYQQPYRGQPRPKYPKPDRQIRNLRKERLRDQANVGAFLLLSISALVVGMINYQDHNDGNTLGFFIIIFIFGLFITASINDGTKKINKFRDGYDFDASILEENRHNEENQKLESRD